MSLVADVGVVGGVVEGVDGLCASCRPGGVLGWRFGVSPEEAQSAEYVSALVERASEALFALSAVDASLLGVGLIEQWAVGVERLRREAEAATVAVAGQVEELAPFAGQGFASARPWLKHRLQISGVEAHRRLRQARLWRRCPVWQDGLRAGMVGVAQSEVMARVAANPAIDDDTLRVGGLMLIGDAFDEPFVEFEARARRWESLADPEGAERAAERQRQRREVQLRALREGGWRLSGRLDEVAGAELNEIFAHFIDLEWRADHDDARERRGEAATTWDLPRSEPQRRADAMLNLARCAAVNAADTGRWAPTVNVLIDEATYAATITGQAIPPERYGDITCRSERGHQLSPAAVVNTSLWGYIRRVVHDAAGVVIDLGRRSRLFRGSARDAVMLLETTCVWVGCDQPAAWCQADHSIGWRQHGTTDPANGGPLCTRHNLNKEHGYRVYRDHHGWHTIHPDGNEIH